MSNKREREIGECRGAPPFEQRRMSKQTKKLLEEAGGGKGAGGRPGPEISGGRPLVPERQSD